MELSKGTLDDAQALLKAYSAAGYGSKSDGTNDNDDGSDNTTARDDGNIDMNSKSKDNNNSSTISTNTAVEQTKPEPTIVDFRAGDFLAQDWGSPTIIFAASACFDEELMNDISKACHGLPWRQTHVRVVTLDRPLPRVCSPDSESRCVSESAAVSPDGAGGEYEVAWQCQVEGCWGGTAVAYVHERVFARNTVA
ncbi:unnamed protein product [Sphacelaria rigidula]